MGIFDWKHWVVILIVVVLVFGTKKLKGFGEDLGGAIQGFKKAMDDGKASATQHEQDKLSSGSGQTVDVKAEKVDADK